MSRLQLTLITGTVILLYLVLAAIYGNNQYINAEAAEILKNGFAVHYLQDANDFSGNNLLTLVISAPLRIYESVLSPLFLLIMLRLCSLGFLHMMGSAPHQPHSRRKTPLFRTPIRT